MMTTGYDCTDILNLGLFRPIFSPTDFIQMKGRGTRRHNFLDQLFAKHWAAWEATAITGEGATSRGYKYLQGSGSRGYGNGSLMASFGTYATYSDAVFLDVFGSSSALWTGTEPQYDCDAISATHVVSVVGYWTGIPSGWSWPKVFTASGYYQIFNSSYLGTGWSRLQGAYPGVTVVSQSTTSVFYIDGDAPSIGLSDWKAIP